MPLVALYRHKYYNVCSCNGLYCFIAYCMHCIPDKEKTIFGELPATFIRFSLFFRDISLRFALVLCFFSIFFRLILLFSRFFFRSFLSIFVFFFSLFFSRFCALFHIRRSFFIFHHFFHILCFVSFLSSPHKYRLCILIAF